MPLRIDIILQDQVITVITSLKGTEEVTTFEVGIEGDV